MAEKLKAVPVPAKPRKPAAKKKAAPSNVTSIGVSREQIAELAHQLWLERGRQHGQDAADWLQAEQLLRGKAS